MRGTPLVDQGQQTVHILSGVPGKSCGKGCLEARRNQLPVSPRNRACR
jgi:hypothetical protein